MEAFNDERRLERLVRRRIRAMTVVRQPVQKASGHDILREYIAHLAIVLLGGNLHATRPPCSDWTDIAPAKMCEFGLWNRRDAEEPPDPVFLDVFADLVQQTVSFARRPTINSFRYSARSTPPPLGFAFRHRLPQSAFRRIPALAMPP